MKKILFLLLFLFPALVASQAPVPGHPFYDGSVVSSRYSNLEMHKIYALLNTPLEHKQLRDYEDRVGLNCKRAPRLLQQLFTQLQQDLGLSPFDARFTPYVFTSVDSKPLVEIVGGAAGSHRTYNVIICNPEKLLRNASYGRIRSILLHEVCHLFFDELLDDLQLGRCTSEEHEEYLADRLAQCLLGCWVCSRDDSMIQVGKKAYMQPDEISAFVRFFYQQGKCCPFHDVRHPMHQRYQDFYKNIIAALEGKAVGNVEVLPLVEEDQKNYLVVPQQFVPVLKDSPKRPKRKAEALDYDSSSGPAE